MLYSEVTDILRHYIEKRFGIVASKSTTEEFLRKISDESLLIHNHAELLKKFLEHCDMVKFAKYDPTEAESKDIIESCRAFILETKREEIEDDDVSVKKTN